MLQRLEAFETDTGITLDSFSRGGTVEQLEQRFAAMLGKEAASLCLLARWPITWRFVSSVA